MTCPNSARPAQFWLSRKVIILWDAKTPIAYILIVPRLLLFYYQSRISNELLEVVLRADGERNVCHVYLVAVSVIGDFTYDVLAHLPGSVALTTTAFSAFSLSL
jgi:hypothetical protein